MKRMILAGALIGLLAFSASAAAATETVNLGYEQDTGPNPYVSFFPETVERPLFFYVTYSATPPQVLDIEHSVHCTRGSESVSSKGEATVSPPFTMPILTTMAAPDSCWISTNAEPPCCDGEDDPGTIRIDATATREVEPPPPPYWQPCKRPRWLKRGRLRVHGERLSCRAARLIASKAWRRPLRQGRSVRARGFYCQRSGRGRRAVVKCSRQSERLELVGKLRRRR